MKSSFGLWVKQPLANLFANNVENQSAGSHHSTGRASTLSRRPGLSSRAISTLLVLLVFPLSAVADDDDKEDFATSLMGTAGGFALQTAADQLGPFVLDQVGLGAISDLLYPPADSVDYERIEQIAVNAATTAALDQDIRNQSAALQGSIDVLHGIGPDAAVDHVARNSITREISKLSTVMSAVSDHALRDRGIGMYVMAANARIGALTILYKTEPDPAGKTGYQMELIRLIDEAKRMVSPYPAKAYGDYIDSSIKCHSEGDESVFFGMWHTSKNEWYIYGDASGPLSGRIWSGNDCGPVAEAVRESMKMGGQLPDWRELEHNMDRLYERAMLPPPVLCLDKVLYARGPDYYDDRGHEVHGPKRINGFWYSALKSAGSDAACSQAKDHFYREAVFINREADSRRAWYQGFIDAWNGLELTVLGQ